MLWQLPRVRELGQGRGTLVWVLLWLAVLTLGTLYFYGGSWLDQWRLV
jgi:type VI protein secretion system component VasF